MLYVKNSHPFAPRRNGHTSLPGGWLKIMTHGHNSILSQCIYASTLKSHRLEQQKHCLKT